MGPNAENILLLGSLCPARNVNECWRSQSRATLRLFSTLPITPEWCTCKRDSYYCQLAASLSPTCLTHHKISSNPSCTSVYSRLLSPFLLNLFLCIVKYNYKHESSFFSLYYLQKLIRKFRTLNKTNLFINFEQISVYANKNILFLRNEVNNFSDQMLK